MGKRGEGKAKKRQTIDVPIPSDLSIDLRVEAKRRGIERDDLVAAILAAVATNQLYAAVLDR